MFTFTSHVNLHCLHVLVIAHVIEYMHSTCSTWTYSPSQVLDVFLCLDVGLGEVLHFRLVGTQPALQLSTKVSLVF